MANVAYVVKVEKVSPGTQKSTGVSTALAGTYQSTNIEEAKEFLLTLQSTDHAQKLRGFLAYIQATGDASDAGAYDAVWTAIAALP